MYHNLNPSLKRTFFELLIYIYIYDNKIYNIDIK